MPDADIVVMEDLRHAIRGDAGHGSDILGLHPVGVHLEDSFHQCRAIGDFV